MQVTVTDVAVRSGHSLLGCDSDLARSKSRLIPQQSLVWCALLLHLV